MSGIWVTRSEPGASRQAEVLRAAGYEVFKAPVLCVEPLPARLPERNFDRYIVLSEQGVRHAPEGLWSADRRVIAIGQRTAAALEAFGVAAEVPATATAEGLLDGPLAVSATAGLEVLIVRGRGGRDLLPRALRDRGISVTELVVYERITAVSDRERFLNSAAAKLAAEPGKIGAIVASSGEGMAAATALLRDPRMEDQPGKQSERQPEWQWAPALNNVPLLVPSARVAAQAFELGWKQVLECAGAGDDAVLAALEENLATRALRR